MIFATKKEFLPKFFFLRKDDLIFWSLRDIFKEKYNILLGT